MNTQLPGRLQKIVDLLTNNPGYPYADLADACGTSLRTIKNDIKELKARGYVIKTKSGIFCAPDDANSPFETYDKTDINLIVLLMLISAYSHLDPNSEQFVVPSLENIFDTFIDQKYYLFCRATMFNSILPSLKSYNLIQKKNGHLVPTTIFSTSLFDYRNETNNKIFGSMSDDKYILDENRLLEFAAHCLSSNNDLGKQVYSRIIDYLAGNNEITLMQKNTDLYNLPKYLRTLNEYDYKTTPLMFMYGSKKQHFFYVCRLLYSHEKDTVYLLGRTTPTKNDVGSYRTLKARDIDWSTLQPARNDIFSRMLSSSDSPEKQTMDYCVAQLCYTMIDVSPEKPNYIEIKVRYTPENYKELQRLNHSRCSQYSCFTSSAETLKKAKHTFRIGGPVLKIVDRNNNNTILNIDIVMKNKISNPDLTIIYQDYISGLSDFANYIRRFGDDVTVPENSDVNIPGIDIETSKEVKNDISIGNNNLRKQLSNGAARAIEKYKEYGICL